MPGLVVAGNWKMHGTRPRLSEIDAMVPEAGQMGKAVSLMVCPPATLIEAVAKRLSGSPILVGAQDCHFETEGPFTGDLSAAMLKDAGAYTVILGHSERRGGHGETSALVRKKAAAALRAGLELILCVGETVGQRAAGLAEEACLRQLRDSLPEGANASNTIIAYEPVWAIGTGSVATAGDIRAMHETLRQRLLAGTPPASAPWRIVYGGSVTPSNAADIFAVAGVDGALVGGASLTADTFLDIARLACKAADGRGTSP